ncbi:hypothetical protein BWI15_09820 [Kribbella sp. ALI-6-A]|uniref:ester cyclase n=1 Tax=Kribbella sp. ALI-6-A TaxID=1933817 RepID=UPI00097C3B63|nr:ester cyclase [Kribbella sp. ALI-6-A]ONI73718.1 hypothetical protein BWI15_09820 [Kribbella sp. ALI-6-A]
MTTENDPQTQATATFAPSRRRLFGAAAGVAGAAALAAAAVPASAAVPAAAQGREDTSRYLTPLQVAAGFYASYNGDLAAGFERYISKDLLLHGFNGPENRDDWIAGDLSIKKGLTGYELTVLDQIVEGTKVVTRWSFGGVHTGTIFGIPASGRTVKLSGISIDRVIKGQSIEHWSEGNFGRWLDELRGA